MIAGIIDNAAVDGSIRKPILQEFEAQINQQLKLLNDSLAKKQLADSLAKKKK